MKVLSRRVSTAVNLDLKVFVRKIIAFFTASAMLFFFVVVLEVFTWAWEGSASDKFQQTLSEFQKPLNVVLPVIAQYILTVILMLGFVSFGFLLLYEASPDTWLKIAGVLGVEHLFKEFEKSHDKQETQT